MADIISAEYRVELRLNGTLIGDVRRLAQNLTWVRRRTKVGVDEIDFTINDVLFERWLQERGWTISQVIKPMALDCRIVRNGVAVMGGFLATMPSYSPNGTSADLQLRFDGYMNLLAGVYMYPVGTQTGRMGTLIQNWITTADNRARSAGKAFGFTKGTVSSMNSVDYTFDNYKSIKDAITDRCDNTTGAGMFDVFFHPSRKYDILKDSSFGQTIKDYQIQYPARLSGVSAVTISADEVDGFASTVIGIGAGEISSDSSKNTAITKITTNSSAVRNYGYAETIYQNSSISRQSTLNDNVAAELRSVSNPIWQPQITLTGRQVSPTPTGEKKIWSGDRVTIFNTADMTGMTDGLFRVNELSVSVSDTGAELITPVLERIV